jgi:hypothetical protein
MKMPDAANLLQAWEEGIGRSMPSRAILLLQSLFPELDGTTLAEWNIGKRDRALLDLRRLLFGPHLQCLTDCANCGETIELDFRVDDILAPCGEPEHTYQVVAEGYNLVFRLPTSSDLMRLERSTEERPEQLLLAGCLLSAQTEQADAAIEDLPERVLEAVSARMGEIDQQAEVLLAVSCPNCTSSASASFDIVAHLWAEIDRWARRLLQEVHALALMYGWSEAEVLRMSTARRRAYLDLIGG